jgi:hypothetical protein
VAIVAADVVDADAPVAVVVSVAEERSNRMEIRWLWGF